MKQIVFSRKCYVNELVKRMHNGMIKIITGLRRSGKSYLLFNLFRKHLLDNGVSENNIIAIQLDKIWFRRLRDPEVCFQYIQDRINESSMHYLLIDEVQLMTGFEELLNSYVGMPNVDVYVTGSNSRFLVTDVLTEFRGRGDEVRVYPLSVSELEEVFPDKSWERLWQEYSYYGGLPQVVLTEDDTQKMKFLKSLFRTTYLKDIIDRYHIVQTEQFAQLADIVASSIGSLTNPRKLQDTFLSKGQKLSDNTIRQYLDYLQDAFLLSEVKRYDIRGKQYIGSPYKYYFTDIGLRNALLNFRQYEETHIMENIIYTELLRRGYIVDVGMVETVETTEGKKEHKRIEIDFVANRGSECCYVQSAFAMPSENKIHQETRPLLKVHNSFKKIIVVKEPVIHRYNEQGISIISLQQFLTDTDSLRL
ncbi:MAG: ATP-binding protein [Paludibacteraceae bacterium]|nr:ATP-binding protein [Paludibacteraceae bacterium]